MTTKWTPAQIPAQKGRRIIVTGGNSGIGWEAALQLAKAGGDVTIAARNDNKAKESVERIRAVVPGADVKTGRLDLADPASVQAFAAAQLARDEPIDLLIHNAGVMALPDRVLSPDGHELQLATNVLGPYRLTGLLLPALLRSKAPRVVTVASNTHKLGGPVPLSDLDSRDAYRPIRVYAKTKLANVLFAKELQRRAGTRLLSVSCHPGAARTNLDGVTSLPMKLSVLAIYPLIQSAARGAEPTLMAATIERPTPGGYYGPTGFLELRGDPAEVKPAPFAEDVAAGRALFDELERMTGMTYDFGVGSGGAR